MINILLIGNYLLFLLFLCLAGKAANEGESEDEKLGSVIPAMIALFLFGLELFLELIKVILL